MGERMSRSEKKWKELVISAYRAGWARDVQFGIDLIDPLEEEMQKGEEEDE